MVSGGRVGAGSLTAFGDIQEGPGGGAWGPTLRSVVCVSEWVGGGAVLWGRKAGREEARVGKGWPEASPETGRQAGNHAGPRPGVPGFKSRLCRIPGLNVMTLLKLLIHFVSQFVHLKKLRAVLSS